MSKKTIYGEIAKVEEQEDGTLKVWGIASSEAEDSDGETITADAMKAALPDYMKFGAVREMHQPKAAGTALEVGVDDNGDTKICAHIVDSEAIKKVQKGVYKGFSIGGRVTGRDELKKTTITGLKLTEISLVDRPANPDAVITCYKADGIDLDQPLAKGMYSVSRFAELLESLTCLASSTEYEAQYERDDSPIPQQLREWLADGADILKAMATEEVDELVASLQATVKADQGGGLAKAAGSDDIAKAGRRNSTTDQAALNQILALAKQLGAENESDADDDTGKLAKVAQPDGEVLAKVSKLETELDTTKAEVTKLATERDTLTKRVKELEAMPEAPKAALKSLEKGDDLAIIDQNTVSPVKKADGSIDQTATLIKAAFANPFRL